MSLLFSAPSSSQTHNLCLPDSTQWPLDFFSENIAEHIAPLLRKVSQVCIEEDLTFLMPLVQSDIHTYKIAFQLFKKYNKISLQLLNFLRQSCFFIFFTGRKKFH